MFVFVNFDYHHSLNKIIRPMFVEQPLALPGSANLKCSLQLHSKGQVSQIYENEPPGTKTFIPNSKGKRLLYLLPDLCSVCQRAFLE